MFHKQFVQVEIKGCRAILHNLHKVLAETLCLINLGLQIQNIIKAREFQSADKEKKGWREWLIDTHSSAELIITNQEITKI